MKQVYVLLATDPDGIEDIVGVYGEYEKANETCEQRNKVGKCKYRVRAYDVR